MFARLYVPHTGTDWNYTDLLDDIVSVLTGATDFTNMKLVTDAGDAKIINTVPSNWTVVETYTSGLNNGEVKGYKLKSPITDSPTTFKYLTLTIRSNGYMNVYSGGLEGSTFRNDNPVSSGRTLSSIVRFYNTRSFYVDLFANPASLGIFPLSASGSCYVFSEYTRLQDWDTTDKNNAPTFHMRGYAPYMGGEIYHIGGSEVLPWGQSSNLRVGGLTAHNIFNSAPSTATIGGEEKYLLYKPIFDYVHFTLGPMHPVCPVHFTGVGVPSRDCGAEVTLDGVKYVVWQAGSYIATASYPMYIKVE